MRTNTAFLQAVLLLSKRIMATGFIIQKIEFEDGSGNKFTGTLWHEREQRKEHFFFILEEDRMSNYKTWSNKKEVA